MTMEESVSAEMLAARARLRERVGQGQQIGGKGTARRKPKKVHKSVVDDKKLQLTLKRIGVSNIFGIEEVYMMMDKDKALHFVNPKVQAAPGSNTYVIAGNATEVSNVQEMISAGIAVGGPGGLGIDPSVLTPDVIRQLQQHVKSGALRAEAAKGADADEVPQLIQNFEEVSNE